MHAGKKEKALQAYLQRAELGFFHEEAALSLNHAAQLKDALGYPDTEIIGSYLTASAGDPKRAHPVDGTKDLCPQKRQAASGLCHRQASDHNPRADRKSPRRILDLRLR